MYLLCMSDLTSILCNAIPVVGKVSRQIPLLVAGLFIVRCRREIGAVVKGTVSEMSES